VRTIAFVLLQAALILTASGSSAEMSVPSPPVQPPDKPLTFSIRRQDVPKDWLPQAMAKAAECTAPVDTHLDPPPHVMLIQLHLLNGTIVGADNVMVTSSGNAEFDKRALSCFANIPHDMTSKLVGDWKFGVRVYASNGSIALLSAPPPPPDLTSRAGITAPATNGPQHSCADMYPPLAMRLNEEGTKELSFIVTATGSVRDAKILRSSGHDDLDQAAQACVSLWQYRPAKKDGVPMDAEWRTNVKWMLQTPIPNFTEYYIAAWKCAHAIPPGEADFAKVVGPTDIEVTIADGQIARIITKKSSGSSALDARAQACFLNAPSNLVAAIQGTVVKDVPVFWSRATP